MAGRDAKSAVRANIKNLEPQQHATIVPRDGIKMTFNLQSASTVNKVDTNSKQANPIVCCVIRATMNFPHITILLALRGKRLAIRRYNGAQSGRM